MSDKGIRGMKPGDMPIVMFFYTEMSSGSRTVTTLLDWTEDELKLQCEAFDIDSDAVLKILRGHTRDTHTFFIDVDVFKLHHPRRDIYIER